jgi:hypothetical protein
MAQFSQTPMRNSFCSREAASVRVNSFDFFIVLFLSALAPPNWWWRRCYHTARCVADLFFGLQSLVDFNASAKKVIISQHPSPYAVAVRRRKPL